MIATRLVSIGAAVFFSALLALPVAAAPQSTPQLGGDPACEQGIGQSWRISQACKPWSPHHGVISTWQNALLWLPDSLAFAGYVIKHGMWTTGGAPCGSVWVEQGLARGAEGGINQYFWYTAKKIASTGVYSSARLGGEQVDSTVTHRYELRFSGKFDPPANGVYEVRRNDRGIVAVNDQGDGSCVSAVGLASNVLPYNAWFTNTFDATSTYWRDTSGNYHSDFGYASFVDNPCGQGYTPPDCFNGVYYGVDWWASNKP